MGKSKRVLSLDVIRTVAILSVIICHASEIVYPIQQPDMDMYNPLERVFAIGMFTFGRMGVPLFFYLTGYLVLDGLSLGNDGWNFLRKKWVPLYVVCILGIIGLTVSDYFLYGLEINLLLLMKRMLLISNLPWMQTWYIPVILGIYLLLPWIAKAISQAHNLKYLKAVLVVVFLYFFVTTDINVILSVYNREALYTGIDFGFVTGYGFYVIIGALLKRKLLSSIHEAVLVFVAVLSFVGIVAQQFFVWNYSLWYNSGLLFISTLCLFELLTRLTYTSTHLWKIISECSFGVYWVHSVIQEILMRQMQTVQNSVMKLSLLIILNTIISIIIVLLYREMRRFMCNKSISDFVKKI